jgi:hypothetical protein
MKWIVILVVVVLAIGFFYKGEDVILYELPSSVTKDISSSKIEMSVKHEYAEPSMFQIKEVDIGEDVNITIETNLTIEPKMLFSKDEYHYIWKENGSIVGTGKRFVKSFSLGEHYIELEVFDADRLVGKDKKLVVAWLYLKEETYYDNNDNEYALYSTQFFDYLKRLVLEFTSYNRREFTYNEYGKVIEEKYESFINPRDNTTLTYEYDGNQLLSKVMVNDEGEVIESHRYDEEGKEIVEPQEEEKKQKIETQSKSKKFYNEDGNLTRLVSLNGKYIINYAYNKNGQVVFTERIHPKGRSTTTKHYRDDGLLISYDSRSEDNKGNQRYQHVFLYIYNDKGERVKKETKQYRKEELVQHIVTQWHYKNGKMVLEEEEALMGVCPCSMDVVKSKRVYEYDQNGTERSSKYWYQKEGDNEMKKSKDRKMVRSYTNVLE